MADHTLANDLLRDLRHTLDDGEDSWEKWQVDVDPAHLAGVIIRAGNILTDLIAALQVEDAETQSENKQPKPLSYNEEPDSVTAEEGS